MDIYKHPIWKTIKIYKKPFHFARFYMARRIASMYPRSTFIGITGSVGKTSTSECCLAVLSEKFETISSTQAKIINLDPIFNIPITILKLRPKIKKVILEMGIEYPEEMDFYFSLVRPGTGIITRIAYAHSQYLGTEAQIIKEKGKLIEQLPKDGFAILNWDDSNVRGLSDKTEGQVIFYGTDPKNCHVYATRIRLEDYQTKFELNYGVERIEVSLKLLGRHMVYPALAAAALGISNGMTLTAIKRGLSKVTAAEHRLQMHNGNGGFLVLDDTYNNASPVGLEAAIDVLSELPAKRRIAVLGEMRELGEYSQKLHKQVAQKIFKEDVDLVFLGGGETKHIYDELLALGFPKEHLEVGLQNNELVAKVLTIASKGDMVLVKGSRSTRLDEVVKRITKAK
jgi:UDP-N-acetylmuramoyl-tripeptide--D-alanyl-D-alanine ligase